MIFACRGRRGCAVVFLLVAWISGCSEPESNDSARFRYVVLVTIDTLRADHLGSYGYPRDVSPFLDELASRGVRFTQALSTIAHTAPSHAAMFTGLSPSRLGLRRNGEALPVSTPTLAASFRSAGWDTAAFTSVAFLRGVAPGFQTVSSMRRSAEEVTEEAIHWARARDAARPFFLWVHYYDVHDWYLAPASSEERAAVRAVTRLTDEKFLDETADRHGWPVASGTGAFQPLDWGPIRGKKNRIDAFRVESPEQAIAWIDSYDARVAYVDSEIRQLFQAIEDLEPPQPGLWIVTSDHGEGLGGHGFYGHGRHVYTEQLHVPLILFATDGSLPRATPATLVSLVDLAPTIADLVGGTLEGEKSELEGISLAALARGGASSRADRPVFAERRPLDDLRRAMGAKYEDIRAIQSGSLKYIEVEGGRDELYDLASDPLELNNLIDQKTEARDRLRMLLDTRTEWQRQHAGKAEDLDGRYVEELRALGYVQ